MKTNRGRTHLYLGPGLALVMLALAFWTGTPVFGQATPAQDQDNDAKNWQLANTDRFLDSHPEVAEQLRKDPSLIRNQEFVEKHPALQEYLRQHPGIREEFAENPNAFMRQENRYERREEEGNRRFGDRDTTRGELASMDRFLDSHPEVAEQLRKDPSLIRNREFVEKHPQLGEFLQQHPGIREEFAENPNAFMRQENRYERREEEGNRRFGDRDTTRGELANMDRFLDSHPEVAEQLRKDPSLIRNAEFVDKHPQLQQFLQQHPGVREEFTENPNAFMRQENRFERHEEGGGNMRAGDRDTTRGELVSFGQFLNGHSGLAQQISKDPSLVNNKEYVENHPELRDYLKAHAGVKEELTENPQAFMNSVQQAGNDVVTPKPMPPKHQ